MTTRPILTRQRAFTLIELMAVVLVILLLTAIGLGLAGYVQRKVAIATTKSQIAAIEAALESYKSDWGYYPLTTPMRISSDGTAETTNNAILYRALFNQGRRYLTFPAAQLHVNYYGTGSSGGEHGTLSLTNIFDVYNMPFNYYCSPTTAYALTNASPGYTFGGQVNSASYDLFSYGADRVTFISTNATLWPQPRGVGNYVWFYPRSALDDLTSWDP